MRIWPTGDQIPPASAVPHADGGFEVADDLGVILCESHGFTMTAPVPETEDVAESSVEDDMPPKRRKRS